MEQAKFLPGHLSPIYPLINLCFLLFSVLARESFGVDDPYFQACSVPDTCGDGQNISYPFYIPGNRKPYCGYPGFELSCNNNSQPTINISNTAYIVQKIFYRNQTLRVSNSAFSNTTIDCIPLTRNVSLPGVRFDLAPNQTRLFLLYNCNSSLLEHPSEFYRGCYEEKETRSVLALSEGDPKLRNASQACRSAVVAPVESYGANGDEIRGLLRRGFLLKWKATSCSICEQSGGFCGFNATTYNFRCLCPDRPHVWHCRPENSGYESCPPGNCGTGPNISYPFYVFGTGEDNCGLPGFGIGCNQSKPIYETSTGQYVIRDIFYENQTFRLVNGEFADGSCFARLHNFTFDRSSLQFTRNHADLLFFYHCNASFSIGYEKSVVACASNATLRSFVVLVNDVRHFNESTSDCEAFVAAPVELEGGYCNQTIGNVDYRKLLKNGFTLEWSGFDCVACQRSGGRCGYEKGDNVCYCHDRIHHSSCHEAPKLVHTRGIARFLEDVKKLRKTSNPSTFQSFLFSPIALQARETCNLQRIQSGTTPASRQRYKVQGQNPFTLKQPVF
ncbi:hypothetical protein CJ030_MR7G017769 [Morella rubra]|uniref:non-specific serine/threonine protein kinase n=1 Tax=Morella rubra TaxID=262757 RepID=A0A6A1V154_9ROSI|nr:hypothetical protein CJ030_MR7G017769 [Morella rubra]